MRPTVARLRRILQNTGSTARDHLASERTFLAWLRTGLGFVALGVAVERFAQLDLEALLSPRHNGEAPRRDAHKSDVLVGALLGTGTGSIVYGTLRYFSTMRLLEQGLFRPSYWGTGGLGVTVAGLAGGVYWNAVRERISRNESRR